uniref:Uncharacterized protein n=1 Tax=Glossina pallidipes TaxID=7398 RepID=A0A1A9ZFF7_GLOPL
MNTILMVDGVFCAVARKTKIDLRIKSFYQNPYIVLNTDDELRKNFFSSLFSKNYLDLSSQGENEPNNARTDSVAGGQQRARLHNDDKLNLIDTYLTQGLKRKYITKKKIQKKGVYGKESILESETGLRYIYTNFTEVDILYHKQIDRRKQEYLKESVIDIRCNGL